MEFDIPELREHNPWWKNPSAIDSEVKIKDFNEADYPWNPRLKRKINLKKGDIHTLRGPRQVGKTTLVKLLIKDLLEEEEAIQIFYYACDILDHREDIVDLLNTYLDWVRDQTDKQLYIFLDEISSVKNWQKGIKLLKDQGKLEEATLLLTGSHAADIKEGGETMPGRRNGGEDKILTPMKFSEYLEVTNNDIEPEKNFDTRTSALFDLFRGKKHQLVQKIRPFTKELNKALHNYLKTGGFPASVNQYYETGEIDYKLYEMYINVVLGDIYKQDKREDYVRDILDRVIETRTTRVSWNNLTKNTDIKHHETAEKYVKLLRKSFILNIIHKADLNKRKPKTSSRKKIYFDDPFIFHAIRSWVHSFSNPYKKASEDLEDSEFKSKLVEQVVGNHLIRLAYNLHPSNTFNPDNFVFYWHKDKEIDFLLNHEQELLPFEVGFKENLGNKGKWIKDRAGTPLILSKNQFEVSDDHAILPASLFLYLV